MAGLPARRAPYKDFLQPALQRRFASTASVLLAVSYAEAVLLSNWDSFLWTWFPFGPAGVRAAILFTCGLAILILRIAHYHVGIRTTGSGISTFSGNLTSLSTYETVFWYGVSAFFFCIVYTFSTPDSANLRWVTYLSGDRARTNERPVFLGCHLLCAALKQSIDHFVNDVDHLDLSIMGKRDPKEPSEASSASLKKVLMHLPRVFHKSFNEALATLVWTYGIYFFLVRSFAYGWAVMILRPFYNMPRTNILPSNLPLDLFLGGRCLIAGALLFFVWSAGNTSFSIFMVKEPLKNGQPLTSESKDPNGSLLNGLKSKKQSIQCFAMWELSHIAQGFPERRKAIYADIDRKEGPMWAQVYAVCMELLKGVEARAENYGKPMAPPPAPPVEEPRQRISAPLREDNILTPEKPRSSASAKARSVAGDVAKALTNGSNSSNTPLSDLSPLAKKAWTETKDHVLTKEQQAAMTPDNVRSQVKKAALALMNLSWPRALLQQTYRTELAGAVLGTPYAEPSLYINAANALCQLAVHSLGEDQFGNVHRDVPSIIRTLTSVIRKVDGLKQRFPVHWTDINSNKDSPEVNEVIEALCAGLDSVVTSFEPFCHDLRLTPGDLRLAKEAAARPLEAKKAKEAQEAEAKAAAEKRAEDEKKLEDVLRPRRKQLSSADPAGEELEGVLGGGRRLRAEERRPRRSLEGRPEMEQVKSRSTRRH